MLDNIMVVKKDGRKEQFSVEKLHKVVDFACAGLSGTSTSAVALGSRSRLQGLSEVTTSDITKILILSASSLISDTSANYQYVAGRLMNYDLRKSVYGTFEVPSLYDIIVKNVNEGWYDKEILTNYTKEEIDALDKKLVHSRDETYTYAAWKQLYSKYLVRNRFTKEFKETPQIMYMLIAMTLFAKYDDRESLIASYYNATSNGSKSTIGLPTPILGGVRTPTRQFSSCVVMKSGDSLESINAIAKSTVNYVAKRAGIGVDLGRIRPLGAAIRNGEATHTGITPFTKHIQTAVGSANQGGIRNGSATTFFPIFHKEIETIIVFKNNKGTEENRVRHLDYGIAINAHFYKKVIANEKYVLFNSNDVPDLYEAFYKDSELFEKLYDKYSKNKTIDKKVISAKGLFDAIITERSQTGRIYIFNVDNTSAQRPFDSEIYQSNLCVAPETKILTKNGYKVISEVAGTKQQVWNGEEWSDVDVVKTGENQKLVRVELSNGQTLECTEYHKFYVQRGYKRGCGGNKFSIVEKRAIELQKTDKIIKMDLETVQHGTDELSYAYESGFYSGDGCKVNENTQRIYLYHEKMKLYGKMRVPETANVYDQEESQNRLYIDFKNSELLDKYTVPSSSYSVESRLEWLAGYLDADGTISINGENRSIQATSTKKEFLLEVQLMLQEIGVNSKVRSCSFEGKQLMPNGKGGKDYYDCLATWRILIPSTESQTLLRKGLHLKRLDLPFNEPNRNATHFVKVEGVYDDGRYDDTYCFTEPKRHMGVFNGILTGQCMEIAIPTYDLTDIGTMNYNEFKRYGIEKTLDIDFVNDIKGTRDALGEIGLCTLSNINMGAIKSPSDLEEPCRLAVYALDYLLDYQDYPMIGAEIPAKARRNLGVGLNNLAYFLAKKGLRYGESLEVLDEYMEAMYFYLLKASVELAKEKGKCDWCHDTIYGKESPQFIWELRNINVDALVPMESRLDWESLRNDIKQYGVRHSTLVAHMPSESNSLLINATNGVEPIRNKVVTKGNKTDSYKQVFPNPSLKYDILWDVDMTDYIKTMAIIQKYTDQAISSNLSYDPENFDGGKVPAKKVMVDILTAQKYGLKTLYYHNTRVDEYKEDDVDCESCKL